MRKSASGFTIVELLIVIVVIGILAAIVIVAFNGIQSDARNTKTLSAVDGWVKALNIYRTQNNGILPNYNSCLGKADTYTASGGYCWDGTSWDIDPGFLSAMSPHIGNFPEPDTSQIDSVNYPNRRGAFYYSSSGIPYIYVMLVGVSSCPSISGTTYNTYGTGTEGRWCRYIID